jgi:uncharacterized protein affecting Mg2+/Co2+ transport
VLYAHIPSHRPWACYHCHTRYPVYDARHALHPYILSSNTLVIYHATLIARVQVQSCHPQSNSNLHQNIIAPITIATTRIFPTAQTQRLSRFVPSAWAVTHTMYSTAMQSEPGTVCTQLRQREPRESCAYTATVPLSASNGKEPGDVPVPSMTPSTFALDVVKHQGEEGA